jgi:hypothetical protein
MKILTHVFAALALLGTAASASADEPCDYGSMAPTYAQPAPVYAPAMPAPVYMQAAPPPVYAPAPVMVRPRVDARAWRWEAAREAWRRRMEWMRYRAYHERYERGPGYGYRY